jgi:hypothetical protein
MKINGFPNNFWGWGGEDDAMYNRLAETGIAVDIPTNSEKKLLIKGLPHEQSKNTNINKKKNILNDIKFWSKNGLSNLSYVVLSFKDYKHPNVHRVTVKLNNYKPKLQ